MRVLCVYTQVEAGDDMLPCVSHLPCTLLTSAFQGERGKLWSALVSCSPSGVFYSGIPEAFRSCQARHRHTSPSDREQQTPSAEGMPILRTQEQSLGFLKTVHGQRLLRFKAGCKWKTPLSFFVLNIDFTSVVHSPEFCIQLAKPFGEAAQSCLYLQFTLNKDACQKAFQAKDLFPRKLLPVCHSSDHEESFPSHA